MIENYSGVYDFALLKTETGIMLDQQIQPICLPYDLGNIQDFSFYFDRDGLLCETNIIQIRQITPKFWGENNPFKRFKDIFQL